MPEVRLIDANALFLKQKSHADLFKGSGIHDDIIRRDEATMALAEILNAPTIKVEPVRKPEMSEADRKKCEEWCKDCEHIEMCAWYPFGGCDFRLLPKNGAVVTPTHPDGREEDSCRACIMDCLMNAVSAKMRCNGSCEKCIAEYLNTYPF